MLPKFDRTMVRKMIYINCFHNVMAPHCKIDGKALFIKTSHKFYISWRGILLLL